MATQKAWCRVCGKEYDVCPTCASVRTYTPWRTICDTSQHYQIWVIVDQYKKGVIGKTAARKMLQRVRIKVGDAKGYIPAVRDMIQEILREPAAAKREKDPE